MYHHLKAVIKDKYGQDACNVGDEGGFAPNIQSSIEGIELLMAAIKKAGYDEKVRKKKLLEPLLVISVYLRISVYRFCIVCFFIKKKNKPGTSMCQ